jgi:hypothetical protein
MADGGILDGLDKSTGGDGSGAKSPKKGKKKTKPIVIIGGVGAAVLFYYLYSKHQANTASSSTGSSAIDPATGVPYADETGSAAIDPATGVPYASELANAENGSAGTSGGTTTGTTTSSDPFQSVDPTSSSGETYDEEIAGNTGALATLESDYATLAANPSTSTDALQTSWEQGLYNALTTAGISGDTAAQDVQNYLNGLPLTTSAAVSAINGYVNAAGPSPGPGGSALVATLANGAKNVSSTVTGTQSGTTTPPAVGNSGYKAPAVVDNPGGGTDAAAVESLTKANAKLSEEKTSGTATQIAAARTNAQNAAKVVEARNKAAK